MRKSSQNEEALALLIKDISNADTLKGKYYFTNYQTAFLFCNDPFDKNKPDMDYEEEYDCVIKNGLQAILFSHDDLIYENKLKIIPAVSTTRLIYRGWMLTPEQYENMYNMLVDKGYYLINTPAQYKKSHYLPEWYHTLADITPKSVWTKAYDDDEKVLELLKSFGEKPVLVKDFVKSRKHEWFESCYIPNASDIASSMKVIHNFIEKQDDLLNGGIVLREFVGLKEKGYHLKSGMPLSEEYRVFIFNGKIVCAIGYWEGVNQEEYIMYWSDLLEQTELIGSNFYTVDIAKTNDSQWIIIEVGDAQVSGLQEFDVNLFYDCLISQL